MLLYENNVCVFPLFGCHWHSMYGAHLAFEWLQEPRREDNRANYMYSDGETIGFVPVPVQLLKKDKKKHTSSSHKVGVSQASAGELCLP
jgi:hypothetical protein